MRIVTIAVAAIVTILALVAKRASGGASNGARSSSTGSNSHGGHDRLLAIEEAARQKPGKVKPPKMPKISRASD